MSFRVPILLYWGGSVIEKEEGMFYDIGPKSCVVVSNTIKYAELYEKLNGINHLAQEGNIQTVRLADRYCSCGKWKIYQVPCSHVIAVCQTLGYDWKQYVGDELYVRSWKKCYEHTIMPIEHQDYWPESTGPTILPCVALRRGKGRPRKNRLKSDMDLPKRNRKPLCKNSEGIGHGPRCTAPPS